MARTDARLELRKARKATAALELNPLLVVRYVAVLQGTSLPPSLACSPGLVLPALLILTAPLIRKTTYHWLSKEKETKTV